MKNLVLAIAVLALFALYVLQNREIANLQKTQIDLYEQIGKVASGVSDLADATQRNNSGIKNLSEAIQSNTQSIEILSHR